MPPLLQLRLVQDPPGPDDLPGQVRDLKLFLRYQGGAVVYVNGAELARGHLPEGKLAPDALATRYADGEAMVRAADEAGVTLVAFTGPPQSLFGRFSINDQVEGEIVYSW